MLPESIPDRRIFALALALAGLVAAAGGCGQGLRIERVAPAASMSSGSPADSRAEVAGGSVATWTPGHDRAAFDLRLAVTEAHWAIVRAPARGEGAGTSTKPGGPATTTSATAPTNREIARITAMLPDGREATIIAWRRPGAPGKEASTSIVAAVRVGRFGDAQAEAAYLKCFDKLFRGPASHPRGPKYVLPP
ncbi:MAG: hypothetical protein NTW19_14665 [Planctomycetota bacterium]|nr:hypothetical protein [Planctomycetota bacterium]